MTTLFTARKTCGVCGVGQDVTGIGSTNRFGPPDLDLRPPEMMRSTMAFWLQECADCGYVAPDIAAADAAVVAIVRSDAYRAIDGAPLLRRFRRAAHLAREAGDIAKTAERLRAAAWAADDARDADAAAACRIEAAAAFEAEIAGLDPASEAARTLALVRADLLRRAGRFEEAIAAAVPLLDDPTLGGFAVFERTKAEARDAARYTTADA